jgi:hypothetical protein
MKAFVSILIVGLLLITNQHAVAVCTSAPEVFFAPNDDLPRHPNRDWIPGPDFPHLFDSAPAWSARTDVFEISPMMGSVAGPEDELHRIGSFLSQHHVALAVGVGAALVDNANPVPGECGFGVEGMNRPGRNATTFKRLKQLGMDIQYIVMDEPLTYAHYYSKKNACLYSIEDTARRVAAGIAEIRQYYPNVRVVDEEAPQITSVAQWNADFGSWLKAYRQATGSSLDAVVLDVDWRMPWQNWASPTVVTAHRNVVRAGIILDGTGPGASDAEAVAAYKQNMQSVDASRLPFDLLIVANWTPHPSRNLPESAPDTLTSVLAWYNARHAR